MRVKESLKVVKPSIKGGIMVLIGIFNTRFGIGVEIFTKNLIYGPLSYLLISFSGILIVFFLKKNEDPSNRGKKFTEIILVSSILLYLTGLVLTIILAIPSGLIYAFNTVIIIFIVIIGILWSFLGYYGSHNEENIPFVNTLIVSLCFSLGLLYGAFLNVFKIIPPYIYLFFFCLFFLQITREFTKGLSPKKTLNRFMDWDFRYNELSLLKYSFLFEMLALSLVILMLIFTIFNTVWFLLFMILGILIICITGVLTLESILELKFSHKIHSILKIGILIELITLLLLGG